MSFQAPRQPQQHTGIMVHAFPMPPTSHSTTPAPPQPSYNSKPGEDAHLQTYEDIKLSSPLLGSDDPEKQQVETPRGGFRHSCYMAAKYLTGVVALLLMVAFCYWVGTRVWYGSHPEETQG